MVGSISEEDWITKVGYLGDQYCLGVVSSSTESQMASGIM